MRLTISTLGLYKALRIISTVDSKRAGTHAYEKQQSPIEYRETLLKIRSQSYRLHRFNAVSSLFTKYQKASEKKISKQKLTDRQEKLRIAKNGQSPKTKNVAR